MESDPTVNQRKPRSKVERSITWSVIVILLVVVFFEWKARNGYNVTLGAMRQARQASEDDPSLTPLTLSSVENLVRGSPTKTFGTTTINKTITYTWRGLTRLRTYTILVTLEGIGDASDPLMLSFQTGSTVSEHEQILSEGAPTPKQFFSDDHNATDDTADDRSDGPPSFSNGGDGQRPSGRGPRSWEDFDSDGDGTITKEESSERMQQLYGEIDTNSDGAIDKEEFEAMRQKSRREGQNSPTRPSRPQRPDADPDGASGSKD